MVNTVQVNADNLRDFNPLADHMTKLRNVTMGEKCDFSTFRFLYSLMVQQALSNLIIKKNYIQQLHKRASMLQ